MANRKILKYPSRRLKEKSVKVTSFDESFVALVKDLADTNNVNMGVGLAAPQIGEQSRVVIIDCSKLGVEYTNPEPVEELENSQLLVLVNPELNLSGPRHSWKEACLSVPGVSGMVERSQYVNLKFQNYYGKECTLDLDWPLSGVVQHECDHLDGILYVNRMRGLSRSMLLKKFAKKQKKIKEAIAAMQLPSLDEEEARPKKTTASSKRKKKVRKRPPKKNHQSKKRRKKK